MSRPRYPTVGRAGAVHVPRECNCTPKPERSGSHTDHLPDGQWHLRSCHANPRREQAF